MKYIMLKVSLQDGLTKLVPIIFPDFMVHEDVAEVIKVCLAMQHKMESEVYSAGEITFEEPHCSGKSETLKVDASDADSAIIAMYDYFHGLVDN